MPSALEPKVLSDLLAAAGIARCLGVPDSTLAPWLAAIEEDDRFEKIAASNECEAVAIAMGQYLATRQPSLIYLQNSGFGKTIHPITSLLAPEIFRLPVLLLIGWRGCPEGHDEPQHAMMGRIMPALLDAIETPYEVLSADPDAIRQAIQRACEHFRLHSSPYALIVRPGLFCSSRSQKAEKPLGPRIPSRQQALEALVEALPDGLFVSTTGKASRELFFIREERGLSHDNDLYIVGGMGCASSIALGIAQNRPEKTVCAVDGDGAALMQLGSFSTIGHQKPPNLIHLVLDNASYESTGGQPTISPYVDFTAIAQACGYPWTRMVDSIPALREALAEARARQELGLIVARVQPGSDPALGRPTLSPGQNALAFMNYLGSQENLENG